VHPHHTEAAQAILAPYNYPPQRHRNSKDQIVVPTGAMLEQHFPGLRHLASDSDNMCFGRSSSAIMIARAGSKLEHRTPKTDTLARSYEDRLEEPTAKL
jgi:hypothetical protein